MICRLWKELLVQKRIEMSGRYNHVIKGESLIPVHDIACIVGRQAAHDRAQAAQFICTIAHGRYSLYDGTRTTYIFSRRRTHVCTIADGRETSLR